MKGADQIARIIPRLASEHDGEVVATVRAIERILKSNGKDWHDLAQTISQESSGIPAPIHQAPTLDEYRTMARRLVMISNLTERERKFVVEMSNRRYQLTPNQASWLRSIYGKYIVESVVVEDE